MKVNDIYQEIDTGIYLIIMSVYGNTVGAVPLLMYKACISDGDCVSAMVLGYLDSIRYDSKLEYGLNIISKYKLKKYFKKVPKLKAELLK